MAQNRTGKLAIALSIALLFLTCKEKQAPAVAEAPGAPAVVQSGGPEIALPSGLKSRIEDRVRQTWNVPQNIPLTVGSVVSSGIAGIQKGSLTFVIPGQGKRSEDFYITEDKRFLLLGMVLDLTIDPFVEIMKKIDLTDYPSKGPEGAKVTIVEYSDFQCPYCARAFATVEGDVLKKYGKKVRFFYKHFPLTQIHPWADAAAIGADCAYIQNKKAFWGFYDKLYKNQSSINQQNLKEKLLSYAKEEGLKIDKFTTCIDKQETKDRVQKQMQEGNEVGVRSTPCFYINGRQVLGAQPAEAFEGVIKKELSR